MIKTPVPNLEAKIAQLQEQYLHPKDLDLLAEIDEFHDTITNLEKIADPMRRDNRASILASKHVVQYYGFNGTPQEQEMLEVILDGMGASEVYRRTMLEECTDELEFALSAAAVVRDRAIALKEDRKDFDMQLADAGPR